MPSVPPLDLESVIHHIPENFAKKLPKEFASAARAGDETRESSSPCTSPVRKEVFRQTCLSNSDLLAFSNSD